MQQLKASVTHHVWSHKATHNAAVKSISNTPCVVTQSYPTTQQLKVPVPTHGHTKDITNKVVQGTVTHNTWSHKDTYNTAIKGTSNTPCVVAQSYQKHSS